MEAAFRTVLNMSLTGSYVILAVLVVRLLLKKAPKKYAYILWSVAAFRLCCPVSFESILSLFRLPVFDMTTAQAENAAVLTYIPQNTATDPITSGISAVNYAAAPIFTPDPVPSVPPVDWMEIASVVWCIGIAVMAAYSLVACLLLRRKLSTALRAENNVCESDAVPSPFILGFIRPKIYLPAGLTPTQKECVLAHERMHLKRRDHWIKLFAYGVLMLHWFNPLCHLAFHMMSKDMEMSCDEAVLRRSFRLGRAYSATLVSLASSRTIPVPSPLAFGEGTVKGRVKNILRWKKPKVWVSLAAAVLCVFSLVACAANPVQSGTTDYRPFDLLYSSPTYSATFHYITACQSEYRITEDEQLYVDRYGEWTLLGTLEEFELTEENFDQFFPHSYSEENGLVHYSFYNGEALRKRIVSARKVEVPYDTEGVISYDTLFYYVLETDSGETYIASGFGTSGDPAHGSMDKLVCMIPKTDASGSPLAEGHYVTSLCIYQSPLFSTIMPEDSGFRYAVEDGNLTISHRKTDSIHEAFVISDLAWEDFPFTEEEWDQMTFCTYYEYFKDSRFLDISLRYFLLEKDGTMFLCEGYHDPSAAIFSLSTIYQLTPEGSEDDPWMEFFSWCDYHIREIAALGEDWKNTVPNNSGYESLTQIYDPDMVLRYCFTRFLQGGETGIEGEIMAAVCKEILKNNGEIDIIGHTYTNGQDWFDQYNEQAKGYLNTLGANTLWYVKQSLGLS